jgi:hypothetical protein
LSKENRNKSGGKQMSKEMLLDTYLPAYDFNEIHAVTIHASLEKAFAAIKTLKPNELSPIVYWLMSIRELPAKLVGKLPPQQRNDKAFMEQLYEDGFIPLDEMPCHETVFGLIGQFWELTGGKSPHIASSQEFLAFDQPGYAKVVANLAVTDRGNGSVRCTTETRIYAADSATKKKFAFYWRLISMGSGFIRILWLNAIKRKAERI